MTHSKEVKEMLYWTNDSGWYGLDSKRGYYLKKSAPPRAKRSFLKWAAYQEKLGDDGYNYSLDND